MLLSRAGAWMADLQEVPLHRVPACLKRERALILKLALLAHRAVRYSFVGYHDSIFEQGSCPMAPGFWFILLGLGRRDPRRCYVYWY